MDNLGVFVLILMFGPAILALIGFYIDRRWPDRKSAAAKEQKDG